jgi:DNA polymerase III subunit alpha
MKPFVHLHTHSQYSLLNGAMSMKGLLQRVGELGMTSVGITDEHNMFGAVDFQLKAKKAGIKPIFGLEVKLVAERCRVQTEDEDRIVLLAKNNDGYGNLRELISMGYLEGLHHGSPHIDIELLKRYGKGLVGLSGDRRSPIARALLGGRSQEASDWIGTLSGALDHLYLEVIPDETKIQSELNSLYREVGRAHNIPLVATNNAYYLDKQDARAHEVLMCIGHGRTLDDPRRPRHDVNAYWLKPPSEMWAQLGDTHADALENTVTISDMCNVELSLGEVYLPQFDVPEEHNIDSFLAAKSWEGLRDRFAELDKNGTAYDEAVYHARLEEEIGIIKSMGFSGYFLIVQDFINWAKLEDIPVGPGRGSGAGSLVAYALRITDLDPIPYGLLFERFLNPERVSMPDFDIDFCMNRRGEVIDYVTQRYGENNVGQIATFGSLKAKGVIRDVGRVMGFNFSETDRLSKLVPDVLGIKLEEALAQEPRLRQVYDEDDRVRDLVDIAIRLEGLFRTTGMHAAGVVIGDKPLWEYCPIFRGVNGELITQFAKDEVELAGLVKFDFLGLKTLTVIDDALKLVNRDRSPENMVSLSAHALEDKGVYKLISKGDTEGVFQLESSGFQELLKKLKPDKFEDIVAAVALYRPGPLNSGMLDDFIARKHGRQRIEYPHESLAGILKETYGVIVYQEQVMQIAQVLAGFTLGAADLLRRAMGKKKLDVMAAQREVFVKGAADNDVPNAQATDIFDLMEKFAEYGFNKSHSAAYALLTYQTGYLKAHHKVEFMAAVLTNDRDNAEKVAKGIRSARKIDVDVLPPCVANSGVYFDSVDGKLLFGLGGVKGVGTTAVEAIVEARQAGGPFENLFDFCERVDLKRMNRKTLEALVKAGACDYFGLPRARMFAAIDVALERAQKTQRDRSTGQSSLFGMLAAPTAADDDKNLPPHIDRIEEWSEQVRLAHEKSTLGVYVSGHPLNRFATLIRKYASTTVEALPKLRNFEEVRLGGIQTGIRVRPFKNGKGRMAIIQFEDLTGEVEIVAMGDDFDKHEALLTCDDPFLITGRVRIDKDEDRTRVSVRLGRNKKRGSQKFSEDEPDVISLHEIRATKTKSVEIKLDAALVTPERVQRLAALFGNPKYEGSSVVRIRLRTSEAAGACDVLMKISPRIQPSDELHYEIQKVFDGTCELSVTA